MLCALWLVFAHDLSKRTDTDDIKENLISLVCHAVLKTFATPSLIKQVKNLKKLWQELFSSKKNGETKEY